MADPWQAEHPVDAALAARLVGERFPELAGRVPRRVGSGFDVDVWRFGDLAFRFPRRAFGVACLAREARVLPGLAPRLPVPVPAATHLGPPTPAFPYPFLGHPYLEGETADRVAPSAAARAALAPALGRFLRALHGIDLVEARALGVEDNPWRADVGRRLRAAREHLPRLAGTPWASAVPRLRRALDAVPPPAPPGQRVLFHGDLYARHLLLDEGGALAGVLDWGDVGLGDPAVDLAVVATFLPPPARAAFHASYGAVDAATWARALALGVTYAVVLLAYGTDVGDAPLVAEAARALAWSLEG